MLGPAELPNWGSSVISHTGVKELTSSLPVAQLHLQLGQPLKPKKTGLGAWESAEERFFVTKLRGFDPQKMVACTLLFEGGPVRWTRRKAASVRSSSITASCGQGPRTASAATGPP